MIVKNNFEILCISEDSEYNENNNLKKVKVEIIIIKDEYKYFNKVNKEYNLEYKVNYYFKYLINQINNIIVKTKIVPRKEKLKQKN